MITIVNGYQRSWLPRKRRHSYPGEKLKGETMDMSIVYSGNAIFCRALRPARTGLRPARFTSTLPKLYI